MRSAPASTARGAGGRSPRGRRRRGRAGRPRSRRRSPSPRRACGRSRRSTRRRPRRRGGGVLARRRCARARAGRRSAFWVSSGSAPRRSTETTSLPISAFRSSGVPSATILPSSMIARRSQSSSASSRYWVVRKIVVPVSLIRRTSSQTVRREAGSRPVVGSSRKRTSGLWTRALARSRRRFIPPE